MPKEGDNAMDSQVLCFFVPHDLIACFECTQLILRIVWS